MRFIYVKKHPAQIIIMPVNSIIRDKVFLPYLKNLTASIKSKSPLNIFNIAIPQNLLNKDFIRHSIGIFDGVTPEKTLRF